MNQPVARAEQQHDVVELRVPCKAEWVALVRLSVAAVASRLHFSIDEIEDIKLAVAEACTNAIQHADGTSHIDIRCEALHDRLRISVRDHGHGTRPESVDSKDPEDEHVGGLGVFLIRSLMDDVSYDAHPEQGTELVMTKLLVI